MTRAVPTNASIYAIAWPLGMNAILQQAIILIDTIIIGGLGESALAAAGIATAVAGLILGILFALSNGTQILVAQSYGANSSIAMKSGFWSGLIVAAVVATFGILFIFVFHDAIVNRLTDDEQIADMASTYLLIFTAAIAGIAICQNISVFLYATDTPKIPFYSKVLELPFNAVVSYALVYGLWGLPTLGVAGAAIGSVLAVLLRLVFLVSFLLREKLAYLLSTGWLNGSVRESLAQHLRNAMPIAGTFISMNFAFTICMMAYSQLAIHEFAAFTILLIWMRTSAMLASSWCQATGIMVGRVLGQSRVELVDQLVRNAWQVALGLSLVIALIYCCTPLLFSIIYPKLEPQTLEVIKSILPLLIILPLVRTSNTLCGNVLRAAGQAHYAFKIHVSVQWLFMVPATLILILLTDASVFWIFSIIFFEEIIKAVPFHIRVASGQWKQRILL